MSLFLGPLSYCINLCVYFCAGIITVLINYSFLVLFEAKDVTSLSARKYLETATTNVKNVNLIWALDKLLTIIIL